MTTKLGVLAGAVAVGSGIVAVAAVALVANSSPREPDAAGMKVGVTHTQTTFFGDPADSAAPPSVKNAANVLSSIGPLQAVPIMGWGSDNPEVSPGQFDFAGLDDRMNLVRKTGGAPVITLCCAPDWMKGGKPGQTDWDKLEVAPLPEHFDDFANLSAEVAKRYPDVKYFQVWNELKGFWNNTANRWDYEGYTSLYNKVYAKIKAIRPDAKVGGPYTTTDIWQADTWSQKRKLKVGDWGWLDDRNLDTIEYWHAHKAGADFVVVDGGEARNEDGYSPPDPVAAAQGFVVLNNWLKTKLPGLPIWYAEFYVDGDNVRASSYQPRVEAALKAMQDSGVSVAMLWAPECDSAKSGAWPCLWTSTTDEDGGGRATAYVPIFQQYKGLP